MPLWPCCSLGRHPFSCCPARCSSSLLKASWWSQGPGGLSFFSLCHALLLGPPGRATYALSLPPTLFQLVASSLPIPGPHLPAQVGVSSQCLAGGQLVPHPLLQMTPKVPAAHSSTHARLLPVLPDLARSGSRMVSTVGGGCQMGEFLSWASEGPPAIGGLASPSCCHCSVSPLFVSSWQGTPGARDRSSLWPCLSSFLFHLTL